MQNIKGSIIREAILHSKPNRPITIIAAKEDEEPSHYLIAIPASAKDEIELALKQSGIYAEAFGVRNEDFRKSRI